MRHTAVLLAAALVAGLSCNGVMAQWKWRDAGGRLTASDLPPPANVPDRDVLARPSEASRTTPAAKTALAPAASPGAAVRLAAAGTDPELEARRKRAADEQSVQQRQLLARDEAARSENCSRAKGQLAALSDGQRMTRTNPQGEREVLDDKGRAEEMQRARAVMASDCR